MSKALSTEQILEQLQQVLHNCHDLAASNQRDFRGIVFVVPLQYRDFGLSRWKVTVEPYDGQWDDTEVSEADGEDPSTNIPSAIPPQE